MDSRELLLRQGNIPWSFLQEVVFTALSEDMLHWEPSDNTLAVRQGASGGWIADWPTPEQEESAQASGAWMLWHMEWWMENTLRCAKGLSRLQPDAYYWSGSLEASREALEHLHADWVHVVSVVDLELRITGLMSTTEPLAFVAAWVTFELTKNAAELNSIARNLANQLA